jgi:beta-glucosidase
MYLKFPSDFIWGTSTAAAQIETASAHNWRGVKARDGYVFEETIGHEKRRAEDVEYIRQLGDTYRCGVDWARLQSAPFAPFDLLVVQEYVEFFEQLRRSGVRILFVIHHFTNPLWFEASGGWENRKNIAVFMDYARQCVLHFGAYVFLWNTFNEPGVYALNGYLMGNFPPFKRSLLRARRVIKNMSAAHDVLYGLLKEQCAEKLVGISHNTVHFWGYNMVGRVPARVADYLFNEYVAKHFALNDYWGMSYYAYVPFTPMPITEIDKPGLLAKMGIPHDDMWGYYPDGMRQMMHRLYKRYGKPILITESGICTADADKRIQSIKDYLRVIRQAMDEGVPVLGYIHWSTFDNFEWNLGPTYRFGLVQVDMQTKERQMTAAGTFYGEVCRQGGVEV